MNDGNDWAQQPSQPGDDQLVPQPSGPDAHPLADNNLDFAYFIEQAKITFERAKTGPILKVFVGITAIFLVWRLFVGSALTITHFLGADGLGAIIAIMAAVLGFIFFPLTFLVSVVQFTLYRPLSRKLFEGDLELGSPVDLLRSSTDKLVPAFLTLLLLTLGVSIGSALCLIPGLVVGFLFSQAPYLAIVRDRGVVEAFTESLERTKRHWHVVLMTILFSFAIVAVSMVVIVPLMAILSFAGNFFAPINYLLSPFVIWLWMAVASAATFLMSTTGYALIDELEGIDTIK